MLLLSGDLERLVEQAEEAAKRLEQEGASGCSFEELEELRRDGTSILTELEEAISDVEEALITIREIEDKEGGNPRAARDREIEAWRRLTGQAPPAGQLVTPVVFLEGVSS